LTSLTKGLEMSIEAAVVLDSVNATELGHFPDDDVADGLINSLTAKNFTPEIARDFKIHLEGKNLANAIARSCLNQRSDAVWSAGNTGSGSSLGQGYTAYGRSYMAGLTYRF